MKKILFKIIIIAALLVGFCQGKSYSSDQWTKTAPAGTESPSDIDALIIVNNNATDRLLADYREGCDVAYSTASAITVGAGQICLDNSARSLRKWRENTSSTTVTFANLDTGLEAAGTYYIWAVADTDVATFTCTLSLSDSAPTGKTYYARLGYFTNDSGLDITASTVVDEAATSVGDGAITLAKMASNSVNSAKIVDNSIVAADINSAAAIPYAALTLTDSVTAADLASDSVTTAETKTATSEVSNSATLPGSGNLTVTGGSYCWWPQIKQSGSDAGIRGYISYDYNTTSYTTNVNMSGAGATNYAQFRYLTASGIDVWIWLLIDKDSNSILGASIASDHPSYGNGGDSVAIPHPFIEYYDKVIPNNLEIILLNKNTCKFLQEESEKTGKSILTLINEEYYPDMSKIHNYEPLHSGKFIDEDPVYINDIPGYIRVRGIKKLTVAEKKARKSVQKETAKIANERTKEEKLIQKEMRKQAIDALIVEGKIFKYITE